MFFLEKKTKVGFLSFEFFDSDKILINLLLNPNMHAINILFS
jgi:hypothetical protein